MKDFIFITGAIGTNQKIIMIGSIKDWNKNRKR